MTQPIASVDAASDYYRAELAATGNLFRSSRRRNRLSAAAHFAGRYARNQSMVVAARRLNRPISLVATGGYGRRELFPYSDIDLLFLCADPARRSCVSRDLIRNMSQLLWDSAVLRASTVTRSVRECERFTRRQLRVHVVAVGSKAELGATPSPYALLTEKVLPPLFAA